jgi:hypothetical protein
MSLSHDSSEKIESEMHAAVAPNAVAPDAERSLISLTDHPSTIKRTKEGKRTYYDEYMHSFVLRQGIDLEYLNAAYPKAKGGIQHIIKCLAEKTETQ